MPLNDYIINVFCLIDDLYQELLQTIKTRKSGYAPILTDSELIAMLIVGEFLGISDNKKIWLYFKSNYLNYFPHLNIVHYKIFNKQATNLWHVIRIIHNKFTKLIIGIRKRIETTISQLTETFSINTTKARSFHGLLGRINRKILSYITALYFNYQLVKDQFTQLDLLIQP